MQYCTRACTRYPSRSVIALGELLTFFSKKTSQTPRLGQAKAVQNRAFRDFPKTRPPGWPGALPSRLLARLLLGSSLFLTAPSLSRARALALCNLLENRKKTECATLTYCTVRVFDFEKFSDWIGPPAPAQKNGQFFGTATRFRPKGDMFC
jgi:hypothetical protein